MTNPLKIAPGGGQNAPKGANLSPAQARYIGYRMTRTQAAAAKEAGVSERSAKRWETLPHVQQALRDAQREALGDATRKATASMSAALSVLIKVMADADTPPAVKVSAARAILESGVKFTETLDLSERIANLEAANGQPKLSR